MHPWDEATAGLPAPLAVVDLDAFDANATDLVRRAGGLPIRVATKSVRCRPLLSRALARPGFAGLMAYSAAEAVWLVRHGYTDVFVAYPTADRASVAAVAADAELRSQITLTIDSAEHLDFLEGAPGLRLALDLDASLRIGKLHLGARRSPLRTAADARSLARAATARGHRVVGLMFYDAQIAGVPDGSPPVRLMQRRSAAEPLDRRAAVVAAVRELADLEFVNAGGTGSLHRFGDDHVVTELAAGSGLYGPGLFDHYRAFTPKVAAAFALPVVRRPGPGLVTVFSGGYLASGPAGASRLPRPWHPEGLSLLAAEGAGEVQTPLSGRACEDLRIGDRVWFRHAKAGELLERFDQVHLVRGRTLVDTVPSYRGDGRNFG